MNADMSILGLFLQAGLVVQAVMLTLLALSIISWTFIFKKNKELKYAKSSVFAFEDKFWSGVDLSKLYAELARRKEGIDGIESVFVSGYKEFARLRQQSGTSPEAVMDGSERSMRVAVSREVETMEEHLSFLATVGSTSPYIGLFGTVWGS